MGERVALGFGNNVDYEIVWDSSVLESLIAHYDIRDHELDINRIVTTERDIVISILAFLKAGIGGERVVSSPEVIERFLQHFDYRVTLGGTSVRAAIAMRKLGLTSCLHLVTINDHVRRLLPQDCPYVCSNTCDSVYPHIIVQFRKGCKVKAGNIDIRAGQDNRIIYHRDVDNINMNLNEDFGDLIENANVLLISGFNAMRSEALLLKRLESLGRIIERLPRDSLLFYEDAGYYEPSLRGKVLGSLKNRELIVSLNEDEFQEHVGRKLNFLDALQIAEGLKDLRDTMLDATIVVHTRYWALAYGKDPERFARALLGGITTATTRYCYGDEFTIGDLYNVASLPVNMTGAVFVSELQGLLGNDICCLPVAKIDQGRATTIGLGDAFVGGFLAHYF